MNVEQHKDKLGRINNGRPLAKYSIAFLSELFKKPTHPWSAAIKAGLPPQHARERAKSILGSKAIAEMRAQTLEELQIEFSDIVRYWHNIATADAREFFPVACCRHCYGIEHQYQYTLDEFREARSAHLAKMQTLPPEQRVPFDERGGDDYDPRREPDPDCPECHGAGRIDMGLFDPRKLSPGAVALFDGLRQTKDGTIEIKLRDRSAAMVNLQRLMGFEVDRKIVHLKELDPKQLSDDELLLSLTRAKEVMELEPAEFEEIVGKSA
jgi:phage terminase small subunit